MHSYTYTRTRQSLSAIALLLLCVSGCKTPRQTKPLSVKQKTPIIIEPIRGPAKAFSEKKQIEMVLDTQPPGAEICWTVRGGGWVASTKVTPVKLSLDIIKQTTVQELTYPAGSFYGDRFRMTKLEEEKVEEHIEEEFSLLAVDGIPLDEYEESESGRTRLPHGLEYGAGPRYESAILLEMEFRMLGYDPQKYFSPKRILLKELYSSKRKVYKLLIPMDSSPHGPFTTSHYNCVLRVVDIPSGKVIAVQGGNTDQQSIIPTLVARMWGSLERQVATEGDRKNISIFGVLDADATTAREGVGRFISEYLYNAVGASRNFSLMERAQVAEFLREQKLTLKDVVDNPKSLQKMTGIDYVILGSVFWVSQHSPDAIIRLPIFDN